MTQEGQETHADMTHDGQEAHADMTHERQEAHETGHRSGRKQTQT
jgi:hypothetical protein